MVLILFIDLAFQLLEAALLLTLAPPLLTNFITLPAGFALFSRLLLECILWNNLPLVVTAVSIPPSARPSPSTSTPSAPARVHTAAAARRNRHGGSTCAHHAGMRKSMRERERGRKGGRGERARDAEGEGDGEVEGEGEGARERERER
jgi:hypothetical protein